MKFVQAVGAGTNYAIFANHFQNGIFGTARNPFLVETFSLINIRRRFGRKPRDERATVAAKNESANR